jgi:hypothetical protein
MIWQCFLCFLVSDGLTRPLARDLIESVALALAAALHIAYADALRS